MTSTSIYSGDSAPGMALIEEVIGPRTGSVAVVIPEPTKHLFNDPYFPLLLRGVSAALAEADVQLVLLVPHTLRQLERAYSYVMAGHVDGVLLVGMRGDDPILRRLTVSGVPVVLAGAPPHGARVSYVDCDNREGGRLATAHLIELGRRQIATISGNLEMGSAVDRLLGYRDALAAAGLPWDSTLEETAAYLGERAVVAMERIMLNHPDVDGVFAASDLMAAAALRALQRAKRRVPEDVALVSFDDSSVALMTQPALTAVRQPIERMGSEMVRLLLQHFGTERATEPEAVIFPTELVVRGSTVGAGAS